MDARHASLGRRTLEEIRQKRAAERLSKASSGPDLIKSPTDGTGIKKSESANRLSENDISGLVSQLKDTMQRNAELEEANTKLTSMLQKKEVENDMLQKRLNDLEQNIVPSLRKALKDVAMEKDAAVVAREDLSAQLRTLKKRIKEAEEEQYRAEEDAAALRAELNLLQQQAMHSPSGGITAPRYSDDQMQAMEKELSNLRSKLEQESMLRQKEHQQLVEEQARTSALVIQKQELEEKLESISKRASESEAEQANHRPFTMEDKERLEKQLYDMAVAIERLESSRQKLLMEIDSQSSEIERLFEENSSLSSAYQESMGLVAQWENQVKVCLKQNEELRSMVDNLRTEQTSLSVLNDKASRAINISGGGDNTTESLYAAELYSLKSQLSKEQSRAEALSGEVLQLSARLQQATQAYNGLARLYKPLLRNIENGLMKMKQDGSVTVR
ncbi:centrosomal protein of 83 kDa isoform X1 [Sesamum indicum]|uniref:Centrosomal protein of 83 kDa isoform X1 n=1 Tax=Sesamum indicum TaxID=4182 RepID=A0A6I9U7E2_SESIN|nr:centrosomal protein of 83 kDa isoform X1 [Sesamum indicum]